MAEETRGVFPRSAGQLQPSFEGGAKLPAHVTREQARAIINAADTHARRLLLECLWQSGGRVSEVLRLRPCDVDRVGGALTLTTLRRSSLSERTVYVSADLVAELAALANDARLTPGGYFFRSQKSNGRPMTRQHCWTLIRQYAEAAGVHVQGGDGEARAATGQDFRHGAAIHLLREGMPASGVQRQLGHARIEATMHYLHMDDAERRSYAQRVGW